MIGQGYILEDISDQELTDGVWYRVSREEKWTTTMPDTFSALYVRTVGEQTISAEALQSVVARLAAQSAPATLDFSTADYVSAEFPALLAGNEKLGGIRLFENTTSIADGAFKGCTALARAVRRASPQSGRVRSKGVPLWRRSRCLRPSHRSPTRRSAVVLRCRRSRWAM